MATSTTAFYTIQNGTTADVDEYFAIPGNFTGMFTSGFVFVVTDTGSGSPLVSSAYSFTVDTSTFDGVNTRIFPTLLEGSPVGSPPGNRIFPPNGKYEGLVGGGYSLNFQDSGKSPLVINPGDTGQASELNLPGRSVLNYGEFIDQGLLNLLENFASPSSDAPSNPIEGQLWFDTTVPADPVMKVFNGSSFIELGGGGSEFWRDPVRVIDQTIYADIEAARQSLITDDTPQGISPPLTDGDRILFSNIIATSGSPPLDTSNIYILVGDPGDSPFSLRPDNNRFPPEPAEGDGVYIIEGSEAHSLFFFDETGEWIVFSAGGGSGATFTYEVQLVAGSPLQSVFTLTNSYTETSDGSGLMVFVNGVKQIPDTGGPAGGAYVESGPTQVTFSPAVAAGKVVEFYILNPVTNQAVIVRETRDSTTGTPITITGGSPGADIDFDTITYVTDTDSLLVYLNGQKMVRNEDYIEVDADTISWIGVAVDTTTDRFEFYGYAPIIGGSKLGDINDVSPSASFGSPGAAIGDVLTWDGTLWSPLTAGALSGVNYDEITISGSPVSPTTVNLTNVVAASRTITTAFQQVFLNGILQREGSGSPGDGNYFVSNSSTLEFAAGVLTTGDEVLVYQI